MAGGGVVYGSAGGGGGGRMGGGGGGVGGAPGGGGAGSYGLPNMAHTVATQRVCQRKHCHIRQVSGHMPAMIGRAQVRSHPSVRAGAI